jgi:phospho-N-acetylmuramoyl-pentapeptide-transferase
MIYHLSQFLQQYFGPARLLSSHILLLSGGTFMAALLSAVLLPRFWDRLPHDHGKAILGKEGMVSKGKPTGAGLLVTLVVLPVIILFVPMGIWDSLTLLFVYLAMLFGFLDDRSAVPWGELKKGLLDAVCSVAIAFFLAKGHGTLVWVPFFKGVWTVPLFVYVPLAAMLLWFTMNATNCSDGVDGLAGSLTVISLVILAILLYVVVGYRPVAHYFLIPCNPEAANWAILVMVVAGGFGGYLWFNAEPSKILMGDAGSRFLGILVGAAVLVTGNPFLILALSPIVLMNGGGGLAKLVILRLAKKMGREIGDDNVIKRIRFPLHDHCKKNLGWSNAQVLMRFILLQLSLMPILLIIVLKVR